MSNSRKSRRNQLRAAGYLKIKNMYNPLRGAGAAWYKKMREDGKALHEYNVNKVKEQLEEFLQTKANSLKTTWIEIGYNETECSKLEEAFFIRNVKNKETSREDKKAARKLIKEASTSLKVRLNATS